MILDDKDEALYVAIKVILEMYEQIFFTQHKLKEFLDKNVEFEDILEATMLELEDMKGIMEVIMRDMNSTWKKLADHKEKQLAKKEKRAVKKAKPKAKSKSCCSTKGSGTKTTKPKGKSSCKK